MLQIAERLKCRAQIGGDGEILGMLALGRAEQRDRFARLAQADINGSQVRLLFGGQLAVFGALFELLGECEVPLPEGACRFARSRLHGNGAQRFLIAKEATPLRWQFRHRLAGIIEASLSGGGQHEQEDGADRVFEVSHAWWSLTSIALPDQRKSTTRRARRKGCDQGVGLVRGKR